MLSVCAADGMTGSGPEDLFGESMNEVQQCVDQVESWRESVHSYAVAEATVHRKCRTGRPRCCGGVRHQGGGDRGGDRHGPPTAPDRLRPGRVRRAPRQRLPHRPRRDSGRVGAL
jgi:hypothetical protein